MKNDEKKLEPVVENIPITKQILVIRDKQVMLDRDLATLYGVETKRINEQVKRNKERFPEDFCFQLTASEIPERLKSQMGHQVSSLEFHLTLFIMWSTRKSWGARGASR